MSTGDGPEGGSARDQGGERGHRGERIGIGGGDDSVTRIQLAARWAEAYGPANDSLGGVLKRFRAAYDFLDSVTHGVEPNELESELMSTRAVVPPAGAVTSSPLADSVVTPPPGAGVSEPRAWG